MREVQEQLQQRQADAVQQSATWQAQRIDWEQRLHRAQARMSELDEVLRQSQTRITQLEEVHRQSQAREADAARQITYLKTAAERQSATSREVLDKVQEQLAVYKKEAEHFEKEAEHFRREHCAALSSRSWRITAPLRTINSRLKKLRRRLLRRAKAEAQLLENSGFFQAAWYLQSYPDVDAAGVNPALHYLVDGWREGRDPGPQFSTTWYLDQNPDIRQAGINPLLHFVRFGHKEGRMPNPDAAADARRALASIPQVASEGSINDATTQRQAKSSLATAEAGRRESSRPVKARPQLWHFVGDSIDWLKAHDQLSGVGRVSTELLLASLEVKTSHRSIPCVFGKSPSGLVAASAFRPICELRWRYRLRVRGSEAPDKPK